jgi:OMF family outer membrane factor
VVSLVLLGSTNGLQADARSAPDRAVAPTVKAAILTLPDAVGRALTHNHGLAAARAGYRAATWAHRQAKANLFPSISLESNYTRLDDETVARANAFGREITMFFPDSSGTLQPFTIEIPQTVFRNGYQTSVNAQMLMLNPAVWNGVALAGAAKGLAGGQMDAALHSTVHQTLRAYLELVKMQALTRLQEQFVAQAARNLAQAQRLADVGRYGEADVLRWEVEVAQQEGMLIDARRGLRLASLTLENLIGLDPVGRAEADSTLPDALVATIDHYRSLDPRAWEEFLGRNLDGVIASHPQLKVLAETERLSRREHRQSLTSFMPSVTVAGSYGWQNNETAGLDGEKTWAVTAAVSVPIFTSFSNYSGHKATKFKLRQTQESLRDARRGLLLAAETARTAVQSTGARLTLAEKSLASARRGHEIQQNRFALGRLSNLEWIDANLALRSAEQGYHTSYYDLVLAIADYHQATGEILALLEE